MIILLPPVQLEMKMVYLKRFVGRKLIKSNIIHLRFC
jgi:hypothetical protein